MTLLLCVILTIFISFGLPDSILGTAWPSIYVEYGLPISFIGYISAVNSMGKISASIISSRLIRRLGTGMTAALSTIFVAAGLFIYYLTKGPVFMFIASLLMGYGAGSIDTSFNNFVVLNYSASKMSFLHCFYGVGVMASPYIMSLALGDTGSWRDGYLWVGIISLVITLVAFIAIPLWRKHEKPMVSEGSPNVKMLSYREVVKVPGAAVYCLAFFFACGLELTVGQWSTSYFVNVKGTSAEDGSVFGMLFYVGLTLGRFISGIAADKLGKKKLLFIFFAVLAVGLVVFALPFGIEFSAAGLLLIGLGVGPIYPNLGHLAADIFDMDVFQSVMGLKQAAAYIGVMVMPWLFGQIAEGISMALLPLCLIVLFTLYAGMLFKTTVRASKAK